MEKSTQTACRLCGEVITDNSFIIIDEVIRDVLDILLLRLDLDRTEPQVMCNICFAKLFAARDFKSICMDTDDDILTFVNYTEAKPIDFKDFYLKRKGNEQQINDILDNEVCRLCMTSVKDGFVQLDDMPNREIIHGYIPELEARKEQKCSSVCIFLGTKYCHFRINNFNAVKDPIVCQQCVNSLEVHSIFLKNCLDREKKIKSSNNIEGDFTNKLDLKVEEIDIKLEGDNQDSLPATDVEFIEVKIEEAFCDRKEITLTKPNEKERLLRGIANTNDLLEMPLIKCDVCAFQTKSSASLKRHMRNKHSIFTCKRSRKTYKCKYTIEEVNLNRCRFRHENVSEERLYKGESCLTEYKSTDKNAPEMQIYKCYKCNYQTKQTSHLINHQLKHKDPSKAQMYKCYNCDYQTKHRKYLVCHLLKHKDPSEVNMYKCGKCAYQSRWERCVKKHQIIHKDPSEVQTYKCDKCYYRAKQKHHLINHQLTHKDPSEVRMYKCDKCAYQSKWERCIEKHQATHKDSSEMKLHNCGKCDYQSRWKWDIKKHQIVHKDLSEIQLHECGMCDYRSKWKWDIKRHQVVHKATSEVQMNKC